MTKNKKRYYGDGGFWNTNRTGAYYEVTQEYEQSLYDRINNDTSTEDIFVIGPDETGKPVVIITEVDYTSVYRRQRERECFPIINRGAAWYNTLSKKQEQELTQWYEAWLDVTETNQPPSKPEWLK